MTKRIEKMIAAAIEAARRYPNMDDIADRIHRADADGYFDADDESVLMVASAFVIEYC